MSSHAELIAGLLPPVSYDPNGTQLAVELGADGVALDRVQAGANAISAGQFPFSPGDLISDWERICGVVAKGTYQERVSAVLAKLVELGGLSIPYFIRLAERMGYSITIVEPQQFRVGASRTGDALYLSDIVWAWHVIVRGTPVKIYRFRTGISRTGERLGNLGDPVLETIFNELKPAHTLAVFKYLREFKK